MEACQPSEGPSGKAVQENAALKDLGLLAASTLTSFPGPHPGDPAFWHQASRINTPRATPGIIKMNNWRIETIYAFVYLKIVPLFIETRKMGIVWQEGAWEGRACGSLRAQPLLGEARSASTRTQACGGRLSLCSVLIVTSALRINGREHLTGPRWPRPVEVSRRKHPLPGLPSRADSTERPSARCKLLLLCGEGRALPSPVSWARPLGPSQQSVKTPLKLRGWVGVRGGEKGRNRLEPGLQQVPFICVLSKSTWVAPCRNAERMKANVR